MSQPLHADYTRCHDGPGQCPMAERCRRTDPAPEGTAHLISHSMLYAISRGGRCEYFIEKPRPPSPRLAIVCAALAALIAAVFTEV